MPLHHDDLVDGWRRVGVTDGTTLIVHSSLSSLGRVDGGASTVVESLLTAVGPEGTVVAPTFTPHIADPAPEHSGVPDDEVRERRDAVPLFHPGLPSTMGAVAEAVRTRPGSVRSSHPQASVAAVGARAAEIVSHQPLGFALGRDSPFARLHDLDARILLIGVGHERNSFLHHAESLTPAPRLKVRRFPVGLGGERVWVETLDVGHDNGTHFPAIGREFEQHARIRAATVGNAACVLVPARPLLAFAVARLTELLAAERRGTAQ
ncbi:AAC(3) family N-acetyltransferase [Allokutzneria albata]|uniref:Aminoglycoside N(3)-acetyltransferase n=1 Tax=Allokutzneria albata TaxID=211114 RepID=A0A1G9XR52_ALLAB|nr:AAC(3) family N-acetyltransferase [Allokutzneria albata]SDM98991.1 aminoglycoside 3-N-acetyltransferase [Allokutzneria albata]